MAARSQPLTATRTVKHAAIGPARRQVMERDTAVAVADLFRILADPTRVSIIHALSTGELCNQELSELLGVTESAMSHQMHDLRLMKLVTAEKRGRMVYYKLADTHIRHIFEDTFRHVREDSAGQGREREN